MWAEPKPLADAERGVVSVILNIEDFRCQPPRFWELHLAKILIIGNYRVKCYRYDRLSKVLIGIDLAVFGVV